MAQSTSTHEGAPTLSTSAFSGQASACDPALYEQMVRPWDLCNTPLERGEFGYRIGYLRVPGITLYRETFDLCCRVRGLSPAHTFAFSIPLVLGSRSTYWGSPLEEPGMPATLPGGVDIVLDSGQVHLVILIDSSLMRSRLPEEALKSLELAAAGRLLPAKRDDVRHLGNWLADLLDRACQTPEMLRHPPVRESITEDLFQQLASAVCPSIESPARPPPALRGKGLDRALAYLRQADPSNLTLAELSQAAGVSQRTLEYAFADTFGLTPRNFIKLQRMHAARRDLIFTSPESAKVTQVAYDHGFYHPARFAKYYRQLFGEQPSVTLKRPSLSEGQRLSPLLG